MLKFMTSMSKGDFEVNINQNSTIITLWQLYRSLCKLLTAFTIDYEYYLTLGRTGRGGGGGERGCGGVCHVFSSCSFIARADFETSSVMVSCHGYEI